LLRIIGVLLAAIGVLMPTEIARLFAYVALLPDATAAHVAAGFVIGIGIGHVSILLGVAGGDLACDRCRALDLQRADRAVVLAGLAVKDVALIDVARASELCATRCPAG
jgi:hypothetical protein